MLYHTGGGGCHRMICLLPLPDPWPSTEAIHTSPAHASQPWWVLPLPCTTRPTIASWRALGLSSTFFRGQEERGPQVPNQPDNPFESEGVFCTASNPLFLWTMSSQDFEHSQLGHQLGEFSPQLICLMGTHQWSWMMRWMPAILSHRGWWVIGSFWVCWIWCHFSVPTNGILSEGFSWYRPKGGKKTM